MLVLSNYKKSGDPFQKVIITDDNLPCFEEIDLKCNDSRGWLDNCYCFLAVNACSNYLYRYWRDSKFGLIALISDRRSNLINFDSKQNGKPSSCCQIVLNIPLSYSMQLIVLVIQNSCSGVCWRWLESRISEVRLPTMFINPGATLNCEVELSPYA